MTSTVSGKISSTYYNLKGTEERHMSTTLTRQQTARETWLLYFNRVLLEQGVISEKEHNQMKVRIQSKYSAGGSEG